jgi:flagellar protein FliO/FliZ
VKKLPINSMAGLALLTGAVLALISPMALALGKSGLPEPGTGLAGNLLHMILGLLAVLAVIFAGAWLLRRSGQMQAGGQSALRIVGGLSLGPRERAVLVQIGDKQLLIGVAPGRVQTLHVLDQPLPQTQGQKLEGGSFAGRLTELLKQRGLS